MSSIKIQKIGITAIAMDCVVNAANAQLQAGGGVCGAIFQAAGHTQLQKACNQIGGCPTGSAVITPGFQLKAKYIIHAVGPVWHGGDRNEKKLLYSCYKQSLKLAMENQIHSIAFPLISAGIFGIPKDIAWRKALQACKEFLESNQEYELDIVFTVLDDQIMNMGLAEMKAQGISVDMFEKHPVAKKLDWKTLDMPDQSEVFPMKRHFTSKQMASLKHGNIPQEMEDKWFWYYENDSLYAHRSWTGFCIFIVQFHDGSDLLTVTVNRDPEQYKCTNIEEDKSTLNMLLDWWSKPQYDYYNEWLSETLIALNKKQSVVTTEELIINGKAYPAVFFHKPEEPNGFLSNWYRSDFTLDGVKYTSAEQYIMYRKCLLFGDTATAEAVLSTDDPAAQQAIARKTKYNETIWNGSRQVVAMQALRAKFSQNESLKHALLDTGNVYLVECAVSDQIWACGLSLKSHEKSNIENWKGKNILGFALMEVRRMLQSSKNE